MTLLQDTKELIGKVLKPLYPEREKRVSQRLKTENIAKITLESSAFMDGTPMPSLYSAEGENISPPLQWSAAPINAKEWILFCEDPDAPQNEPFVHWIIYNIPITISSLPEGIPTHRKPDLSFNPTQTFNSKKTICYSGPIPPVGHGPHHYYFEIFALDTFLNGEDPSREDLIKAIQDHVVAWGELQGTYERK